MKVKIKIVRTVKEFQWVEIETNNINEATQQGLLEATADKWQRVEERIWVEEVKKTKE